MLPTDSLQAAETQSDLFDGENVMHLWDGSREVSARFAEMLSLTGPGWDLYLLYRRGIRWDGELPPTPTFWMHQLSPDVGADPALYLRRDPNRLGQSIAGLLAS